MLILENISKVYPNNKIPSVEGISFQVKKGELLSLLGESGSGKSTILRIIAGLEKANKGRLVLNDEILYDSTRWIDPEKRNIGLVFQGGALFPHMNVNDNISYGVKEKNKIIRKSLVEENLEIVKLLNKKNSFPHELSEGERQRVALARTLACNPKLVLLDEPYSNLDLALNLELREQVKNILVLKNISGILVTHSSSDARHFANKIAILRKGKLLQFGLSGSVSKNPNCKYCNLIVNGEFS